MCFYGKIMLRIKLIMQHIMEKKVIAGEKSKEVGRPWQRLKSRVDKLFFF